MSTELYNVKQHVTQLLKEEPETRDNDDLLFVKVYERINPKAVGLPYFVVMANRKRYGLPTIETIRRCRQKAQELNPELRGSKKSRKARAEKQEEFEAFARSKA